jgi:hypothetical protein
MYSLYIILVIKISIFGGEQFSPVLCTERLEIFSSMSLEGEGGPPYLLILQPFVRGTGGFLECSHLREQTAPVLALVKRPSALPNSGQALHFYSSAGRPFLVSLPLHWVDGLATAIALVTIPPEGGICYGQVCVSGLVFRGPPYSPHHPSAPLPGMQQQMMWTSHSLVPMGLSLCWVRSPPCHQRFVCQSYDRTTTSYSTLMCSY